MRWEFPQTPTRWRSFQPRTLAFSPKVLTFQKRLFRFLKCESRWILCLCLYCVSSSLGLEVRHGGRKCGDEWAPTPCSG